MRNELSTSDLDSLGQINAASEDKQALGGVPIGIPAKLTGFELVIWIVPTGLTISSRGRDVLSKLHYR